jgi:AraC-like DNA-binding protein/ligand-binding sensor protein
VLPSHTPLLETDDIVFQRENIRYLLQRRLRRAVEVLVRETVGKTPPVFIVLPETEKKLLFRPSTRDNAYCKMVYDGADGCHQCSECYRTHLAQAVAQKEPLVYTCHAGLTNALIPIQASGKTIGGLVIGRALPENPSDEQKQKLAAFKHRFRGAAALTQVLKEVPVISETDLQLAGLIARNLVQTECPMLLEAQIFDPALTPSAGSVPTLGPTVPVAEPVGANIRQLRHHRVCQKVIDLLERQYASPITVVKLADAVKLTPNYLSSVFHKTVGITLGDYLTRVRIKKAQSFLQRPDVNIKEVAYRVGFTDANHFAVAFKKITGCTPTEWRARMDEQLLMARPLTNSPGEDRITDLPA